MVSKPKIHDRRVRPGQRQLTKEGVVEIEPTTKPNLNPDSDHFLLGLMLALNPPEASDRETFPEGEFLFCD